MLIKGYYTSVWDDGIEITSEAIINLDTKEVMTGSYVYAYAFDELDLEILEREYITIGGVEYPCCQKGTAKDGEYWYSVRELEKAI